MKPKDLIDIPKVTRSAIREIPKTWQSLSKTYLQPVTKKEVFHLNAIAVVVGILAGYAAIGFRYLIAKQYGFNMGIDVARGPEDTVWYIQAGSAW